jgi:hypothetical protein
LSRNDSVHYFFLFHTIHDVLKAEKTLKDRGCRFELVPVPRALSSDCGVCIRTGEFSADTVSLLFSLNMDRCFSHDGKEYTPLPPHDAGPAHDRTD